MDCRGVPPSFAEATVGRSNDGGGEEQKEKANRLLFFSCLLLTNQVTNQLSNSPSYFLFTGYKSASMVREKQVSPIP
jgi:hypothetical protein